MAADATPLTRWEPTAKWETRYREVRDAAATAFAEKGYVGASLKDVADRLGIRAASLYYYLPSKDAALAAVCEHGIKTFIDNLRDIVESRSPTVEKVRAVIANQLLPLRKQPDADYVRVFLRHRHELPEHMRRHVVDLSRDFQKLIERIFADGVASREFRAGLNPHLATLALLGLCNSVIGARSLPRTTTIDNFVEEYCRIFIEGVTEAPSGKRTPARVGGRSRPKRR